MKKFADTVIVTDLDGTFINDGEGLVQRNLRAIEYFKANGGYFTVATGRVAEHVRGAVPCIDTLINLPAVTCNGACLYDFSTGEMPFVRYIEYGDVVRISNFIYERFPSVAIRASSPEYCFVCSPEDMNKPLVAQELKRYENSKMLIAPISEWNKIPILKVVLRIDENILSTVMKAFGEFFGDRFSYTQSWSTIMDIQPRGINKGVTLDRYVRERFGSHVKVYACGDYVNDIEMLKAADVAVCPSNAHPDVKKISGLCLCSNNEGLIADLIEHIEKGR